MNRKLTIALILAGVLIGAMAAQVSAQSHLPGVQPNDYFTYSVRSYYQTSNPNFPVPASLVQTNNTDYYNVTVTQVQVFNVTRTNQWHFNNGTQEQDSLTVQDTDTGINYYMYAFEGIYDSNLNAGDLLRPGSNDTARINQTITTNYPSGPRESNVITIILQVYDTSDPTNSTIGTGNYTYVIDRETGVLVQRIIYSEFSDHSGSEVWALKETNRWTVTAKPSEFPWTIVIAAVVIAAIVIVAVVVVVFRGKYKRRRKVH
jgi:hypothetical protein